MPQFVLLAWTLVCLAAPWIPGHTTHSIFNYTPPLFLAIPVEVGALVILVRLLRKKKRRYAVWSFVGLQIATLMILGFEIRNYSLSGTQGDVRVMTFNVQFDAREVPSLRDEIIAREVDVVMLQEVKGGKNSPAEYLKRELKGWSLQTAGEVAILSRWPLSEPKVAPLQGMPGRVILSAEVNAPKPFRAMTTHWGVPQFSKGFAGFRRGLSGQWRNCDDTLHAISEEKLPVILGGDFNNPPGHVLSQHLSETMKDAFSVAGTGMGWTYPAKFPLTRIDHLYSSSSIQAVSAEVGPSLFSDHRMLIADFAFSALQP